MEIYINKATGQEVEIHPAPHGGRYVEMIPVAPKQIDWSRVNFDVVPVKLLPFRVAGTVGLIALNVRYEPTAKHHPFVVPGVIGCTKASLITGKRIAWDDGDDCPLPEGVIIKVALHSGSIRERDATTFLWGMQNLPSRIVWFEVVGVAEGWVE